MPVYFHVFAELINFLLKFPKSYLRISQGLTQINNNEPICIAMASLSC